MNAALVLSIVTLTLQLGATVAAFSLARAPGWEKMRLITSLAATAGLYAINSIVSHAMRVSDPDFRLTAQLALSIAAVHSALWIWYTFSDELGTWRSVPRHLRQLALTGVGVAAFISVTGTGIEPGPLQRSWVPSLATLVYQPRITLPAQITAVLLLGLILVCYREHLRRAFRGAPGAAGIAVGFTIFLACAVEEAAVATGLVNFIYLAELGYLALIIPVTGLMFRRFIDDARRLARISDTLADEVDQAVAERDAARSALATQERMAALGRIASGVGHEINNPLQYLLLSLEEIRDATSGRRDEATNEALSRAFEGTDRIRRVVEGLRTYASPAKAQFERIDLTEVVQSALRVAMPQVRGNPTMELHFERTPVVMGDEGKLVQVIVNAVLNAAHSLRAHPPADAQPLIRLSTRTGSRGRAELEVRDNGPGFPPELLPRLGEPFVTTRATTGGTGLGIFVIRGIVDAHGGVLEVQNLPEGGATLRILLPSAPVSNGLARQGTTAVASISTIAPGSMRAATSTADIAG